MITSTILAALLMGQGAPAPEPDETPWLPLRSSLKPFPSACAAWEQVARYREHLKWLERRRQAPVLDARYGRAYWTERIAEAHRRHVAWELLANASDCQEAWRFWGIPPRAILGMLRDALGWEAYERGEMPPELPELHYPTEATREEHSGNLRQPRGA